MSLLLPQRTGSVPTIRVRVLSPSLSTPRTTCRTKVARIPITESTIVREQTPTRPRVTTSPTTTLPTRIAPIRLTTLTSLRFLSTLPQRESKNRTLTSPDTIPVIASAPVNAVVRIQSPVLSIRLAQDIGNIVPVLTIQMPFLTIW